MRSLKQYNKIPHYSKQKENNQKDFSLVFESEIGSINEDTAKTPNRKTN